MKYLVTGGAGYIGSVFSRLAHNMGRDVTILDNLRYGGESILGLNLIHGFRIVTKDAREISEEDVRDTDCVVHLAAIVGEAACDKNPSAAWSVNYGSTVSLANLCKRLDKRLVFSSTCSNYGSSVAVPDEESPLKPLSCYSETKVEAEKAVINSGGVVLRFATAFGVSPRTRFDLMINQWVRDALEGKPIEVYAPTSWRPFCHVYDISCAILVFSEFYYPGEVINIGHAHNNITKGDLAQKIKDSIEGTVVLESDKGDKRDYRVNFSKSARLGFTPRMAIDHGINELVASIQGNYISDTHSKRLVNA